MALVMALEMVEAIVEEDPPSPVDVEDPPLPVLVCDGKSDMKRWTRATTAANQTALGGGREASNSVRDVVCGFGRNGVLLFLLTFFFLPWRSIVGWEDGSGPAQSVRGFAV